MQEHWTQDILSSYNIHIWPLIVTTGRRFEQAKVTYASYIVLSYEGINIRILRFAFKYLVNEKKKKIEQLKTLKKIKTTQTHNRSSSNVIFFPIYIYTQNTIFQIQIGKRKNCY